MSDRERLRASIEGVLETGSTPSAEVFDLIATSEPADVARIFADYESEDIFPIFRQLDDESAGLILIELNEDLQRDLVHKLAVGQLERIVRTLPPDDGADIYQLLPEGTRKGVLDGLDADHARQIRTLAAYEPETAGAIMTTQFAAAVASTTVRAVLDSLGKAEKLETDQVYVTDEIGHLLGAVSIQDLLQEDDKERAVGSLPDGQVLAIGVDEDQEEVTKLASTYGLTTVPIVDRYRRLVGIVTADDLDFVAEVEASEDMYRLAGTVARHPTKMAVPRRILLRLPTLLATVVIGVAAAQILRALGGDTASQEGTAMRYVLIVLALAGNVGAIANTIVVRGLATQEIEHGRLLRPFVGEFLVGLGVAAICAFTTWLGIGLIEGSFTNIAAVVGIALLVAVTFSAVMGFCIPLVCESIGIDPALAGPIVIALNDLAGTSVYVGICLTLLPAP